MTGDPAPARTAAAPQAGDAPPLAQALRLAAHAVERLAAGVPLEQGLEQAAASVVIADRHPRATAAAKDLAYTATRRRALCARLIERLAARPPAPPVAALLAVALAQLVAQRHAEYAVVDQAVRAAKEDDATRAAAGFVNGVLRNALRGFDALVGDAERDDAVRLNLPPWWLARLRRAFPDEWERIARAQLQPPPLVLRVNLRRATVEAVLDRLAAAGIDASRTGAQAVWLTTPRAVDAIPGFAGGEVAVQDAGAQLAVPFLGATDGMRVLDACAAPGGKTAHLAECGALEIDAVESDPLRAARIEDNLRRLRSRDTARVQVMVADAAQPARYAQGRPYDRILLDAPCTASGIVRRHPDIPWLRRPADVAQLATQQSRLLEALWPLLKPAGRLLYVVCSLFPEEGAQQIEAFVARHGNARALPLPGAAASAATSLQLVPSDLSAAVRWPEREPALPTVHDGFFYALIEKR